MNINVRFTILALVFVLSTVFFWQALTSGSSLLPSRAQQATNVRVFVSEATLECNTDPDALCLIHLFASTQDPARLAGVAGGLNHDDTLSFEGYTQEGFCAQASFGLDSLLGMKSQQGDVSFAFGALKADDQLAAAGNKCVTTLGFKPVNVSDGDKSNITLSDSSAWQVVGSTTLNPAVDTNPIDITFSPNAPIPDVTLTPPPAPGQQPPGGNCQKAADCNCNDVSDMEDWELARASVRGEGASCDLNNDGLLNAEDLSIWINENELVQ